MIQLAVDTALAACSAAVLEDERVLAHRFVAMARGHAEALAPMVADVMALSGLAFSDLDRLATTTGPGTFTGQRIGLAFMRALAVALEVPLIGVTSLAAMGAQAMAETGAAAAAVLHDARRNEVYREVVGIGASPAVLLPADEAEANLVVPEGGLALAGTKTIALLPGMIATAITAPDAVWVARLAARRNADGPVHPFYLRPPDAKLPAAS